MDEQPQTENEFAELSKLYLFDELYKFIKDSPGLAISFAYLVLLLSSMSYLHVLFSEFDINIVKYVTFEDILATPIKNPKIIFVFFGLAFLVYIVDSGNRWRARYKIKYANKEKPFFYKVSLFILWAPQKRNTNIKVTFLAVVVSLSAYIYAFANLEASDIKQGQGSQIEIKLVEGSTRLKSTLLGTSSNFLFAYDPENDKSKIFYLESIESITHVSNIGKKDQTSPQLKQNVETTEKPSSPAATQDSNP